MAAPSHVKEDKRQLRAEGGAALTDGGGGVTLMLIQIHGIGG